MTDMLLGIAKDVWYQYRTWRPSVATRNVIYNIAAGERKRSFGSMNPDRTVYIIRSIDDKSRFYTGPVHNLLANYFYVISHLQYARLHGWTPVVDQLNYPVYNSQTTPVNGSLNPWEYFWEQPGGISLEEAYSSRNVVLSKQSWFGQWDMGYAVENYLDRRKLEFYHELCRLAPLNAPTAEAIENARKGLSWGDKKVLGVNVRVGGHSSQAEKRGEGHPLQPEPEELLDLTAEYMNEWGYDYIYLASDVEAAVKSFERRFGYKVLTYQRQRAEVGTEFAPDSQKILYAPGRSYQTALDYLTEMELLSRCDGLIGSVTSGLRYALARNGGKYRHVKILDRGLLPDKRKSGKS